MPALGAVAATIAVCCNLIAPAGAVGRVPAAVAGAALVPVAEVDLGEFSARAEEWNAARAAHREATLELALDLAAEGRAAEEARLAAQEAARIAEEQARAEAERRAEEAAAAAATSTTAAPTTVPPTTAPPSTVAPTTVPSSPDVTDPSAVDVPTDTAAPDPEPAAETPVPGEPTAAQWDALRRCESSNNYAAVGPGGRYRGAYQFSQATWDWVAGFANPALVGVDPAAAAPADQDALALALWRVRGWSPWPHCGAGL